MSTRSHIGIWNEDGSLDVIYCHWDGYPSYNGALLLHHYQDPEKIRELIALGDISSLAESVKPVEGEHTFESPQEGVVVPTDEIVTRMALTPNTSTHWRISSERRARGSTSQPM